MDLEKLLEPRAYLAFLSQIARGKFTPAEREDWLSWFGGNVERLERVLVEIGKRLLEKHYTVLYPIEFIPVPKYPFSKQPMVSWADLKNRSYGDTRVARLRYVCGRLGNLINVGFILRNIVLVDIDCEGENCGVEKMVDVRTRRGFHKIFYIPEYEAVEIRLPNQAGTKAVIRCGVARLEIMSGNNYLGSHPLQSRYLEFKDGRVHVRRYKILSREAEYAFHSADWTPLKASLVDVREFLEELFDVLGCSGYSKHLELKGLERDTTSDTMPNVKPKESRFNVNPLPVLGEYSYRELKEKLSRYTGKLPKCLEMALFGRIEKGYRWFHLRLLLAVLPYFVMFDEKEVEELVKDFSSRTNSTRSDVRQWLYSSKYFTGKIRLEDKTIYTPSVFGVPQEAWSAFEELGWCSSCPLSKTCLQLPGSRRRRLIVEYVSTLLGVRA